MELYLDSGNIKEIEAALSHNLIDGITTNPSLVMKEGKDLKYLLLEIKRLLKKYSVPKTFTVSAEVVSTKYDEMIKEGIALSKIDSHIIIKVPLTYDGLQAVKELKKKNIRTNVTLCFSTSQAILAAKAGAYIISPFVGRLEDTGSDGIELLHKIRTIYENYNFKTKILSASIRSISHVENSAIAKADICTIPSKILLSLIEHPLTDKGIEQFNKDWISLQKNLHK